MHKINKAQLMTLTITVLIIAMFACSLVPSLAPVTAEPIITELAPEPAGSSACSLFDSISAAAQYSAAPPMMINIADKYYATVKMSNGEEFVIELFASKAPITVNSFVFLACKGFFNGVTFHRVLEDFMAQGGDPTGTGTGGPGYEFVNENSDMTFDKAGVLAMANAGPDTNGSQFFITFGPQEFLNGGYTIFGQVTSGMDIVNSITRRDPDQNPSFTGDAMESITITTK